MPTDLGELQRSWIQLKNERDTYREQFHDQERKVLKLTRQLQEERVLNDYISTKRKRPWDFDFYFLVLDLFCLLICNALKAF